MVTSASYLLKSQYRSAFIFTRVLSSIKQYEKIQGIRENFSEYEVRLHFDQWLKSLWLAPSQWVHLTRDRSIRVTRRLIPFWSISIQGSIQCTLSTKSNIPFHHGENYYSHKEWHSFPLKLDNISLNDINIYAAENFDRYHVQRLDVSFDNVELVDLEEKDQIIEKPTIDEDTAFNHAWILIMKPLLENMCLEEAQKIYPKFEEPRIDSFHLKINSKQKRLLYYPIYIINYNYNSRTIYTCLFDGLTGYITGDRQYSVIKVTMATFMVFHPMVKFGIFSFASLANLLFAFEIAADLSLTVTLPIALVIAPCVGFYARSYPKLYKREISQVQWKQDQSKAVQFTYDSIEEDDEDDDDEEEETQQSILQTSNGITEIKLIKKRDNDLDSSIEKSKNSDN